MSRDKDTLCIFAFWAIAALMAAIINGSWYALSFFCISYWIFRIELAEVTCAATRDMEASRG